MVAVKSPARGQLLYNRETMQGRRWRGGYDQGRSGVTSRVLGEVTQWVFFFQEPVKNINQIMESAIGQGMV